MAVIGKSSPLKPHGQIMVKLVVHLFLSDLPSFVKRWSDDPIKKECIFGEVSISSLPIQYYIFLSFHRPKINGFEETKKKETKVLKKYLA
jgi:hypothetical protein